MTLLSQISTSHNEIAFSQEWVWALAINHLWQSTVFAALAFAVVLLLRSATARARYAVWLVASAKFVLPSLLLVSFASRVGVDFSWLQSADREHKPAMAQLTEPVEISYIEADGDAGHSSSGRQFYSAVSICWLVGFVVLLGAWIRKRRAFATAVRAGAPAHQGREAESLKRVASWLMLRRQVRLIVSPLISEPGVWGTFRPTVVVPETMACGLDEAELDAVMMHELVHVSRYDNLVSSLQMFLCCLFWFHPLVWLIDKELLVERESACDEKVVELCGAHGIYASSLLKVLKFCLGVRVAGVSAATGSNLKRRIDKIMANEIRTSIAWPHRLLIVAVATTAIAFSIAAGLFSRDYVSAQARDARRTGVPGGIVGGVPGGIPGGVEDQKHVQDIEAELENAPAVLIQYKNIEDAPVNISEARLQYVQNYGIYRKGRDGSLAKGGDAYAVKGAVTVVNNTNRAIMGVVMEFRNRTNKRLAYSHREPSILDPNGSATLQGWRWLDFGGDPSSLSVRIVGVRYEDGEYWGLIPPPPPPPPPPPREKNSAGPPPPPPDNSGPPSGDEPPVIRKSGGLLHGKAIRRVEPNYPEAAKAAQI
ncbi:MAG TPA: M56 family metallopeptidase, partial [Blastocatellia bacterium]|nr:M56 family metallopeptidase [Blastocatellia bacterium]